MAARIGALTIGQSPRRDLVASISQVLPDAKVLQSGALDELSSSDLPGSADLRYPLSTELRDGTSVLVDENFLAPLLQNALERLEEEQVHMTILLCSAPFDSLRGRKPLLKPFEICLSLLRSLGVSMVGVVTPNEEQSAALNRKWSEQGISCSIWSQTTLENPTASLDAFRAWVQERSLELILIDFYGIPAKLSASLNRSVDLPFIDIERLSVSVLASCFV